MRAASRRQSGVDSQNCFFHRAPICETDIIIARVVIMMKKFLEQSSNFSIFSIWKVLVILLYKVCKDLSFLPAYLSESSFEGSRVYYM